MKVRIEGKRYDTDTAKRVFAWDNGKGRNDFYFKAFGVYRKRTGEFFIHGEGGGATVWGYEDKDGARSFGEGIFPIADFAPGMIKKALNSGTVRFSREYEKESFSMCLEDRDGNVVIFIGYNSRFAPVAENSGIRIG